MFAILQSSLLVSKYSKKDLFTLLLKDGIDVTARSNFASSHYHGTNISIIHFVTEDNKISPPVINIILPLLRDKVHTLNMQAHCMLLNINPFKVLIEGQTPVKTCNQPLFALSMGDRYRNPKLFNDYAVQFGAHIEQSFLGTHADLINGSGLLEIINHLNFTTIGLSGLTAIADVSSIKRARYSMQITLSVLYSKLTEAAQAMGSTKSPYEWLSDQAKVSESCFYWKMILDFHIKFHVFIRSIREGNFDLYVESLRALIIWCFIMDKYNYARWLTVHIFELITMHVKHTKVHKNLKKVIFFLAKVKEQIFENGS